ncbi:MAG TPA: PrsW family glutamic-type intramembrane protease, partial [Polyangiaceae bacterium]|nr:PrsW family glutamic-type intramembrane protease [Polyangiaceae bacterium]
MFRVIVAVLLVLWPFGLGLAVFLRAESPLLPSRRLSLAEFGAGALLSVAALTLERYVLGWTELSFEVGQSGVAGALLATFLLAAPLEEGLKVFPVWALYRARRIAGARMGAAYGAACGAGFAAVEALAGIAHQTWGSDVLRLALSAPAHVFFAGAWGYALGAGRRARGRWFSITWFVAMLLHGLFDHILWGRGMGQVIAVAPLLLFMLLGSWLALRSTPPLTGAVVHSIFPEPPSIETVRAALRRPKDHPLMLRWIVFGSFVTLGLMLVSISGAVLLGRRLGVDFALADQTDGRAAGPLMLLGAAVLLAFPLAGYLVARASATHSLLEPAWAAALTVALLVGLLALAAPIGVLFALAVAPIALGLACGGAWVG